MVTLLHYEPIPASPPLQPAEEEPELSKTCFSCPNMDITSHCPSGFLTKACQLLGVTKLCQHHFSMSPALYLPLLPKWKGALMPTMWNQTPALCCSCAGGWKAGCEQQHHIKLESFAFLSHKVEISELRTEKAFPCYTRNSGQRVKVGGMRPHIVFQLQKLELVWTRPHGVMKGESSHQHKAALG